MQTIGSSAVEPTSALMRSGGLMSRVPKRQRSGSFDATTYRDRYQEALRELIEAKMKGPRDLDAEMVAVARAIIGQRTGSFDPTTYRDRYQEALRELIEK